MANTPLFAGAGFIFRIFAARPLYAAEAVGLGSVMISAIKHLSPPPLLGFDIELDQTY
jgi:hypothetical protein